MSWRRYFLRTRKERELEDEIESYLGIAVEDYIAAGMSRDEALAAARRKFGNTTLVKENVRDMNSINWLEDLWSDVKYGARLLRLNPGFFAVATLSLALGIGANTAIFQLLNAVRLRTLPVAHAEQLAQLKIAENEHCCDGNFSARNSNFTYAQWEQIRDHQEGFSSIFAYGDTRFNIAERGEVQEVDGLWVTGSLFRTLGVNPALGRMIDDQDDRPGCGSPVAVISYPFWQRQFGGDRQVIGKKLALMGKPVEIVGVTPANFFGVEVGRSADVMVPVCAEPPINAEDSHLASRRDWWLGIMGRLKSGWTVERAKAQAEVMSGQVFENSVPPTYRPETVAWYVKYRLTAEQAGSGVSELRENYEHPLWLLFGIAVAVLLIACANLANLMLARASVREREMAVRLAIGAGRGRLVRQLLAESALLTVVGTILGAFLAQSLSSYLITFLSTSDAPLFLDLGIDWRMLMFTAAVAIVTCLLFGLTPALRAASTSPGTAMKAGGRSVTADRSRFGVRRALVIAQVALSLVLLCGALMFGRSLHNLTNADVGLVEEGLLIMNADLTKVKPEQRGTMYRQLLDRLRATPGIEQAATSSVIQLSGNGWNDGIEVLGGPAVPAKTRVPWFDRVSSGYFSTMGIRLLAGRDFNERDTPAASEVAIVTEKFRETFLQGADPIGKQIRMLTGPGEDAHVYQIVGLVKDSKYQGVRRDVAPIVYVASTQEKRPPSGVNVLLRSHDSAGALTSTVKRVVLDENGDILLRFQSFKTMVDNTLLRDRLMATLSGFFGFLAAILATVGLYGVISYMVARRKNEIGIRVALGANNFNIVQLVIREAAVLLAIGMVIGIILTLTGARVTTSLLYGLQAHDPLTVAMAVALLGAVSLLASFLPALRASRLDPVQALREE